MNYNKILNLEDFYEEEMIEFMKALLPHQAASNPRYPRGSEIGKAWEMAMTIRAFKKYGVIHKEAEILGVGTGEEATIFYLTNHVKRVFATDLYVESGVWSKVAAKDMLSNPGSTLPPEIKWDPKRLVVQHMDGRNLRYPDNTFDGIFSNSSIEHFGGLEDVAQSAREMGRVLKPGGTLNIATEYKIKGPDAIGFPGAIIFDKHMLEEYIIKPSGLFLADDIDDHISDTTLSLAYPLEEAVNKGLRIPSVALLHAGFTYTSVSLTLLKKR